jgi:uncharacterized protein with PIN domain
MAHPASATPELAWHSAEFRFYEELNDFLPKPLRKRSFPARFRGSPAIKDTIEAQGVPHTEVDLILVNGESVGFGHRLRPGDRAAVYPVFESLDITPLLRLRERPLRRPAFVVDANLGKLSRRLRMLGFDTLYDRRYHDAEITDISARENRIVLTRDRRLLFAKRITHGYWVRSVAPDEQVREVLRRLDLSRDIRPLHRCIACNGILQPVAKEDILDHLEPKTRLYYDRFLRCGGCGRIYWEGSHVADMRERYLGEWGENPL